ncbi:MAG: competence/damage-inducible protein A [Bacillota bacterium]
MQAEIISIGTEILLGDIIDSNSKYIANKLTELGYDIHHINTVGDNKKRLVEVLKTAIKRSDLIITTGGLGPTDDDLTREAIADVTNNELYLDKELLKRIKEYFNKKGYTMTKNNYKQAYLPQGADYIKNDWGTAPGIFFKTKKFTLISLPGVPKEMKNIFSNYVLNKITKNDDMIFSRTLNFFGIGESTLETKLKDILEKQDNPTLALLAGKGEVKLRITAKGNNKSNIINKMDEQEKLIRNRVGQYIYGSNNSNLAKEVFNNLIKNNLKISFAESCTGGLISHRLTENSGSSKVFRGALVVYSNNSKKNLLNIKDKDLKKYGAVSEKIAEDMAINVKKVFNTNIGVGVTGIAGPTGGNSKKPVGLVYIGISFKEKTKVYKLNLNGNRSFNKWMSSQYLYYYLLKILRGNNNEI